MKLCYQIIPAAMLLPVLLFSWAASAHAAPTASQDRPPNHAASTASTEPYRLTLSLAEGYSWASDAPYFMLTLTNWTRQHTLLFLRPPVQDEAFEIEYKAPTEDPWVDTGWQPLKPNVRPAPKSDLQANPPDSFAIIDRSGPRFVILPGQNSSLVREPDFPMSKKGFYRIKTVMTIPDAREFDDSVNPSVLIRDFTLVVRSEPFVVRRTADSSTPVTAPVGKPAAPK